MATMTLADEYGYWALAQVRKALAVMKVKRGPSMVKILTVSDKETALVFAKVFENAKNFLARKDRQFVKARDYAIQVRREGEVWGIYLDNHKAAIRRIQRERRRR